LVLIAAAKCLASFLQIGEVTEVKEIAQRVLADTHSYSSMLVIGQLVALAPDFLLSMGRDMIDFVVEHVSYDVTRPDVVVCLGVETIGAGLLLESFDEFGLVDKIIAVLERKEGSGDAKKAGLLSLKNLAKKRHHVCLFLTRVGYCSKAEIDDEYFNELWTVELTPS
jgi:hypothetical protein